MISNNTSRPANQTSSQKQEKKTHLWANCDSSIHDCSGLMDEQMMDGQMMDG